MDGPTLALLGLLLATLVPALGFAAAWGGSRGEIRALREALATHVAQIDRRLAAIETALEHRTDGLAGVARDIAHLERRVAVLEDREGLTPIGGIRTDGHRGRG